MSALDYIWLLGWQRIARQAFYYSPVGITVLTPCLYFSKGKHKMSRKIADLAASTALAISNHDWSKPWDVIYKWVDAFTLSRQYILDPFTGGGTVPAVCKMLNRRYLAFEIDPETAEMARERVRNTQPPLPIEMPEQLELEVI